MNWLKSGAYKMLNSRQSFNSSKKLRNKENIPREEVNKAAFRGKHRRKLEEENTFKTQAS